MFELAHPGVLLALPAPLLVYWLLPPHREQVSAIRVPFFAQMVQAVGLAATPGALVLRRRRMQMVLMISIWTLLVAGLSKPQWVGEPIERTETSRDLMLAIDLSGSMDSADFTDVTGNNVTRFDAVQRVVDQFVAMREHDRVGLIVFGTRAYLQLPFTRDLQAARALVDLMEVGMAGPKTALGDAVGLAIHTFASSDVDARVLILLTDGNDTASTMTPINAAAIASAAGVEIHTIGIGNPQATGEDRVDFTVLQSMAERTGGRFFNAEDESALAAIYRRIDEFSPTKVKTQSFRPRTSLVHWPAGMALLLGLAGVAFALLLTMRGRGAA